MIAVGSILAAQDGRTYRALRELGAGAQGAAYEVEATTTRTRVVAKVLLPTLAEKDAEARLDALVAQNLSAVSPALAGPFVRLRRHPHGLGSVMPKADGQPLDELLRVPSFDFQQALGIALAIARAIEVLEERGISHGDLAATNVMVKRVGGYYAITIIDFENALLPGAPAPPLLGQKLYLAPEILAGATVSQASDRYALAVLLHEVLLLRHPFSTELKGGVSFKGFARFLAQAEWKPTGDGVTPVGGLPVAVLNRTLRDLFKRALQPIPPLRPSAAAWSKALYDALRELFVCDACDELFVNDPSYLSCPHCRAEAPVLALEVGGRTVPFQKVTTTVGRDEVMGDMSVSRRHCEIMPRGFAIAVRNLSKNGTDVCRDGVWRTLLYMEEALLAVGDRIRFSPGVGGVIRALPA